MLSNKADGPACFYKSDFHEAIFQDFKSKILVIAFSERKEPPPAEFFGKSFFQKENISYISVRNTDNSWYLRDDFLQLMEVIKNKISDISPHRVILFGASMGSFGCLRAANHLLPHRMILCAPLASLDPKIERRWASDYSQFIENYFEIKKYILPVINDPEIFCLFDSKDQDNKHVNILKDMHNLHGIDIPDSGHMVLQYLKNSGILSKVIRILLDEFPNISKINNLLLKSRKCNKSYLLGLSEKLNRRPSLQEIVLNFSLKNIPNDNDVLFAMSEHLSRRKIFDQAAGIIQSLIEKDGNRCLGVPLGKAIAIYTENGGKIENISSAIALFTSDKPRSRGTQLWYSRFLRFGGFWDRAFKAHEQFMGGDAFEAHAHIERGLILEKLGLLYAATKEFELAVQFAPDFNPARGHLSRAQLRLDNELSKAISPLTR